MCGTVFHFDTRNILITEVWCLPYLFVIVLCLCICDFCEKMRQILPFSHKSKPSVTVHPTAVGRASIVTDADVHVAVSCSSLLEVWPADWR